MPAKIVMDGLHVCYGLKRYILYVLTSCLFYALTRLQRNSLASEKRFQV